MEEETNLAETCRENDDFIYFAHFLQEIIYARALDHVDIVPVVFNLHRDYVVSLLY